MRSQWRLASAVIENDWFEKGTVVVTHSATTNGSEPSLKDLKNYFFERVGQLSKKALAENNKAQWPLIVLHSIFKDNQPDLLRAVWKLLGDYEPWLTNAVKTASSDISPFDARPILAITEDPTRSSKSSMTNALKAANCACLVPRIRTCLIPGRERKPNISRQLSRRGFC